MDEFNRAPVNAWTSLTFAYIPIMMYVLHHLQVSRIPDQSRWLHFAFFISCTMLGWCSYLYHASSTWEINAWDWTFMCSVISFFGFYFVWNLLYFSGCHISDFYFALAYVFWSVSLLAENVYPTFDTPLTGIDYEIKLVFFGALSLIPGILMVSHLRKLCDWKFLLAAFTFEIVAFLFAILDHARKICFPDSLFQGIGLFHCLTAFGIVFLLLWVQSYFHPKYYQFIDNATTLELLST